MLQAMLDDVHNQFIDAVAEGRKLPRDTVLGFADGRIVSGQQARSLRMVDALGGLEEAIADAAKLAGLPEKPRLILPRRRFSLFDFIRNQLGVGGTNPLLATLPFLRTPLYLMD